MPEPVGIMLESKPWVVHSMRFVAFASRNTYDSTPWSMLERKPSSFLANGLHVRPETRRKVVAVHGLPRGLFGHLV